MRVIRYFAPLVAVGLGLTACSTPTNSSVNTTPATSGQSSTTTSTQGSTTTTRAAAHVGSTLAVTDEYGNKANVTLQNVIDPAQGADQYTTPDQGKRFVGAQFQITDTGSRTFSGDANNDAVLIGSNSQSYTTDLNSIAGCTDFNDGAYTVASGQNAVGCVTFQVPIGVSVSKVQFTPSSGLANTTAQWVVS